jgi:bacterioferritin
LVEGCNVALEEFARQMIHAEELHAAEVDKMLRKPGEVAAFGKVVSGTTFPGRSPSSKSRT